ncbi:MAG: GntR family transcriptional regulator [Chloroflexota bacterium]
MNNQSVAQRLHDQLGKIIAATHPGERLPSEPLLAEQLGVSRATLREAMRTYETQGIIRRKQGSGTYVNRPPQVLDSGLEVLESIDSMAERSGLSVSFGALTVERRPATEDEAASLGLPPGEELLNISRVILAEGHAVAFLVDALPTEMLSLDQLQAGFKGSILDMLLQRGEPQPVVSMTEINSVPASSKVARALGIQRGDVLLNFVADLYDAAGRVVDHSQSYFLPGYFRFHVVRRIAQPTSVA